MTTPTETAGASEDRVLTIPNIISVIRLSCLPVFVWLLFGRDDRGSAALLLAALGITDWVDGYIARRWHQVSTVGKVLDPVADRLLFFVGVGCIIIDGSVPMWFAVAVLVREVLVAVATVVLAALGARRIDVTWYGKAGTFGLMVAFPSFLASHSEWVTADFFRVLAWVSGIPGLIFSWYSAVLYVPIGRAALRDARSRRAATTSGEVPPAG
jgi:cardiolipin synthase